MKYIGLYIVHRVKHIILQQSLRSLVNVLIKTVYFCQVRMECNKFHFTGAVFAFTVNESDLRPTVCTICRVYAH